MAAIPNLTKLIRSIPLSFLSSSLPSALFARSKSDFVLFWTSQSSFTAVFDPVCFFQISKSKSFSKRILSYRTSHRPYLTVWLAAWFCLEFSFCAVIFNSDFLIRLFFSPDSWARTESRLSTNHSDLIFHSLCSRIYSSDSIYFLKSKNFGQFQKRKKKDRSKTDIPSFVPLNIARSDLFLTRISNFQLIQRFFFLIVNPEIFRQEFHFQFNWPAFWKNSSRLSGI